jgi:hypothetical protein
MSEKLCKDCRFAKEGASAWDWVCSHPKSLYQPPASHVTGTAPEPYQLPCEEARRYAEECGPKARYWEPLERGFGE